MAVKRVCVCVTCRLTAKNRDQLRNPTLGRPNGVWATFTFLVHQYYNIYIPLHGPDQTKSADFVGYPHGQIGDPVSRKSPRVSGLARVVEFSLKSA